MKRSRSITLVLITAALASCHKSHQDSGDWMSNAPDGQVHMRSDTSARYTNTGRYINMYRRTQQLWYYAFRPYGICYGGGNYQHIGYYTGTVHESSNIGRSSVKSTVVRGGIGSHAFSTGG